MTTRLAAGGEIDWRTLGPVAVARSARAWPSIPAVMACLMDR